MENPLSITSLNDFIFCPASIYFHMLDSDTEKITYQSDAQLNGTAAHDKVDNRKYSSRKDILQGIGVYSEKYNLVGKIDCLDTKTGILTERKNKINKIYDGYIFQLYGQYFALKEMGYSVKKLSLYSYSDNKRYMVALPEENPDMFTKFEKLIVDIQSFKFEHFLQNNPMKCLNCIYSDLCPYDIDKEGL